MNEFGLLNCLLTTTRPVVSLDLSTLNEHPPSEKCGQSARSFGKIRSHSRFAPLSVSHAYAKMLRFLEWP